MVNNHVENPSERELEAQGLVRPSGYVGTEGEVGHGSVTCSSVTLQLSLLPAHDLLGNPAHSILHTFSRQSRAGLDLPLSVPVGVEAQPFCDLSCRCCCHQVLLVGKYQQWDPHQRFLLSELCQLLPRENPFPGVLLLPQSCIPLSGTGDESQEAVRSPQPKGRWEPLKLHLP